MELKYKIIIIFSISVIGLPVLLFLSSSLSLYMDDLEFLSRYPSIEITGTIEIEKSYRYPNILFRLVPDKTEQKINEIESYGLDSNNIDTEYIGKKVSIKGIFLEDYDYYGERRNSMDYSVLPPPTGPVIIVKEIEILN